MKKTQLSVNQNASKENQLKCCKNLYKFRANEVPISGFRKD